MVEVGISDGKRWRDAAKTVLAMQVLYSDTQLPNKSGL